VLLLERYNHLGGLSTGGLVIWIDRMSDWSGTHIIRGIASDIMDRLPRGAIQGPDRRDWGSRDAATAAYWAQRTAAFHGIVTWSPTVDPEALKTLSLQMVCEAKVRLLLHAWAAAPILEGNVVTGVLFESKEGRQAIAAKVVVDASGDADLIARAHAACESDIDADDIHHCVNTAFLLGGVDMERWLAFRSGDPQGFSAFMATGRRRLKFFEKPFVSWRNDVALFMGPRLSGYSRRAALARARDRPPRGLPVACAGVRGRVPDARRSADRRAPQPPHARTAQGHAPAVGQRIGL